VGVEYILYYLFHFVLFDDYKDALSSYTVEEGTTYTPLTDSGAGVADMDLVAENDLLKLYADTTTGYVAVYDKATGETTYSNPSNADEDTVANETNKNRLKSQLVVTYYNSARTEGSYTSYSECVNISPDQLSVESIENGIRFIYEIKPKSNDAQVVPYVMSEERYNSFVAKMDTSNSAVKTFLKSYTQQDNGDYEIIQSLQNGSGTARVYHQIYQALYEQAGYTEEDYLIDMEDSGFDITLPASFTIPLEYRLQDDRLVVSIPTSEIEEVNGSINGIELLPSFGAASSEETGYMLVPNGSGSLINFNNGKTAVSDYTAYVYGLDPLAADYTKVENAETVRLPLYAICRENSSILTVIEDGASLAQIKSSISGKLSSYNSIWTQFTLRGSERLSMFGTTGSSADIPVVENSFYDVDITVSYSFLGEEYTGYSGVANYYRERLIAEGTLTENGDSTVQTTSDIGFYYDIIGGVKETDFIVGVQYLAVEAMTTFKQAQEIAQTLSADGIQNQIINYQGWMNGGYYHDVTDRVKLVSKLGSEKDFESLASLVEGYGGKVYGDVAFQKVSYISKRYNSFNESARYYSGYAGMLGQVNPTTLRQTSSLGYEETLYSLVSPKFLVRYVDKFLSKADHFDITGYSLRDLGDVLASDKKRTELITREDALDVVEAQLQKFADSDKDVMVSGGNDYAVSYADDLINVPIGHNEYFVLDEEVPFYEMVYHGTVDYACFSINSSDSYDVDDISLRLIEYGASPHFTFTYAESNEMKYTGLNSYYSTTFTTWEDTAVEIYNRVNEALKYVKDANIVNHEILQDGVKRVTYSNGVVFTINTTASDVTVDGTVIGAESYVMGGVD
jgi:hypothetical protein